MNRNKEPWDINLALQTAKGFQEAGRLIYKELKNPPHSFGLGVASGVNYSIAIELHLKILFYFDKGHTAPNSHKLAYIYNELSPLLKTALQSDFQKLVGDFDKETLQIIREKGDLLEGYFSYAEKIMVTWRYFGLDFKAPPESGFIHINEVLGILDNHIRRLKESSVSNIR